MDEKFVYALKTKDYSYIIKALEPLYFSNLKGVPIEFKDDLLQDFYLETILAMDKFSSQMNNREL